mmetsp:Transcript_7983/g.23855  ORF Transcript_7983/g.23855 Transcript_7983/m.23855 type:complete len:264 (-) Transcript_7983:403-1194(-)
MRPSALSWALGLIIGPTSQPGSSPPLTFKPVALSAILSMKASYASPTKTAAEIAMHLWPAAPAKAPVRADTVASTWASGRTTAWFLAPMLDWTLFPAAVPREYTCFPAPSPPTKLIALMSWWSQIAFTMSCWPCTMFSTPLGRPASMAISASMSEAPGSCSLGFRTKVLPTVQASGYIHRGTMAGKLKGQIPATTPRGCLIEYVSIPPATFSISSPMEMVGTLHANSTTSSPLKTSPLASARVLPCSTETFTASSSKFARINS